MGVPGFIPGVLDFSLWKSGEVLKKNKDGKEMNKNEKEINNAAFRLRYLEGKNYL